VAISHQLERRRDTAESRLLKAGIRFTCSWAPGAPNRPQDVRRWPDRPLRDSCSLRSCC